MRDVALSQDYKFASLHLHLVRKCAVIAVGQGASSGAVMVEHKAFFTFSLCYLSFEYSDMMRMGSYKRSTTVIKLYQTRYFG